MTDADLIAMMDGMAYQIEGEAREVRANNDSGPDWATTTLSRHVENLDCDAKILRAAIKRIAILIEALGYIEEQTHHLVGLAHVTGTAREALNAN